MMIDHAKFQALKADSNLNTKLTDIAKVEMDNIMKDFSDPMDENTIMLLTTLTEVMELTGQLLQASGADVDEVLGGPMQSMCGCILKITGKSKDDLVKMAKAATRLRSSIRAAVEQVAALNEAQQERASATLQ